MHSTRLRRALLALLATSLVAAPLWSQDVVPRWHFSSPDGAEALFAVLRDVPLGDTSPFPFYQRVASRRHVPTSLQNTLRRDPAFDVLHFVPLYVANADRRHVVATLRTVAAEVSPNAQTAPPDFATAALLTVLPRASQRRALSALADAVAEYAVDAGEEARAGRAQVIEHRWQSVFAAALAPFLRAERLEGGRILLIEALGAEGRVFVGNPGVDGDNVVAVSLHPDVTGDDDASLFAVVRELCFPLVSRIAQGLPDSSGHEASAARSSLAAVRCGDLLMARAIPELNAGYRRHWLAQRRGGAPSERVTFQAAYPPERAFDAAIVAALDRAFDVRAPASAGARKSSLPHDH